VLAFHVLSSPTKKPKANNGIPNKPFLTRIKTGFNSGEGGSFVRFFRVGKKQSGVVKMPARKSLNLLSFKLN
jgi:hypothetical protein